MADDAVVRFVVVAAYAIVALVAGWVGRASRGRERRLWLTEESIARMQERQCLKRMLVADDLVGPCLFLASDSSAAMTAQTMIIDGGVF